jgi:hypothetical protein
MAKLVPRSTDSMKQIRENATKCIENILFLQNYEKKASQIQNLKVDITKNESNLTHIYELSKILCNTVTSFDDLFKFIDIIIYGLLDTQVQSSIAACIFLNYLVKTRANEIKNQVLF